MNGLRFYRKLIKASISDLLELHFLPELVDLLQVGDLIVGVDKADRDVPSDAAVAVDVSRRAVGRH